MIRPIFVTLIVLNVPAADSASANGLEVSVMSFNARWDGLDKGKNAWANPRPVAIKMIKAHGPDVIGLQEPSSAQTR
ncbi:MAG: hypothetical protein QF886_06060, partial [Planctomycetota bacterium]|nr:hypothetical protein [Planctomycetota bacterium]